MTILGMAGQELLTAQQMKDLEDRERRVSDQVWTRCQREGQQAFIDGTDVHRLPANGNRDMVAAWRLGWYMADEEARMWKRLKQQDQPVAVKPTPSKKRRRK
jgi:hypothetical protein